jgi:hypothetical protein
MSGDGSPPAVQVNRSLLVGGGVLVGIGGLLGFTGMALVSSALLSATRQWVNQLQEPPRDMVRRKWRQASIAAHAGAEAWRNGPRTRLLLGVSRGPVGRTASIPALSSPV